MIRPLSRALLAALVLAPAPLAQFEYSLAFDTAERLWHVEGTFSNPGGGDLTYAFARWTPGAYHIADYGRFVDTVRAWDGDGRELEVERIDDSRVLVKAADAVRVRVAYEAVSISDGVLSHGAVIDVESNRIRDDYAYVNPVSLFGFVPGRTGEEYSLAVELPEGWEAACVLPRDEGGAWRAESFERFEDSPLLFSPTLRTVEAEAGGKPLLVSVHGKEGEELDELVEACVRISEAAIGLMGGAPYDRYQYLLGFVPEGAGSGLEHSYSTLILAPTASPVDGVLGLIAHEFFHLYCAERIHVQGIREPDFLEPLETQTIWVNESMTEYMSQHVLLHAGYLDQEEFFQAVGPTPMTANLARLGAPTEISKDAWEWSEPQDLMRFAMKMYHHGPRIVLALDMEMRRVSEGERGVVDFLRYVMEEYHEQGRGFPEDGVLDLLEKVAGGELDEVYERFVAGAEDPDLALFLEVIGCEVVDGAVRRVPAPTEAQQAAWEDYFSVDGL